MPHTIHEPRHQRLLANEFGIRGIATAPHLESTIQPVVVVADLSVVRDPGAFEAWASAGAGATGGVSTIPIIFLKNPAGSGTLLVVAQFIVQSLFAGVTYTFGVTSTDLTSPLVNAGTQWCDRRRSGAPAARIQSGVESSQFSQAGWGQGIARDSTACVRTLPPGVIRPGEAFAIMGVNGVFNVDLMASFQWTERQQ
jgi:hypothetical protein